jgi:hypothetical protein
MTSLTRRSFIASAPAVPVLAQGRGEAPSHRRLLESRFEGAALLPGDRWKPYPPAADRQAWESIPAHARAAFADEGAKAMKGDWPIPPATLFLEFVRIGNRANYERAIRARRDRLQALVLAECAEGKGRLLETIADGIWSTCEETFWGYPAHLGLQRDGNGLPDAAEPIIDLFAAEAGALLAWSGYLLGAALDKVHPQVRKRLDYEIRRRILIPYRDREDFWWMGLNASRPMNNWNPWINSNCLVCTLLVENDTAARTKLVEKIVRSVDRFLDSYSDDGGCDEGPGYWGHAGGSLFDNLELLHSASDGRLDYFGLPIVQEIGRYIYRANIADDWYVNFADASARVNIYGDLVYRYGLRIHDDKMQSLGAWAVSRSTNRYSGSLLRTLPALFGASGMDKVSARQPLVRDVWLPGIQVMAARVKDGSPQGLYLAAQGGHNAESHNHNDVGNFIVYADGCPAIIDVGVETYTAKTFSSRRYEIWTMQSAFHNLPTVNGAMQSAGRLFAARAVEYRGTDEVAEFSLDIARAYPAEAGIESWRRTLRLDRPRNEITVRDVSVLQRGGGSVEFTLMTPCVPSQTGPGAVTLKGGRLAAGAAVHIAFDPALKFVVEAIPIEDARLKSAWGSPLHRILLKAEGLPQRREFLLRITQS